MWNCSSGGHCGFQRHTVHAKQKTRLRCLHRHAYAETLSMLGQSGILPAIGGLVCSLFTRRKAASPMWLPPERHTCWKFLCLKGAKQITLSNESDNSFINKHACTEYTLACFTHHHSSQKSYKDELYTVAHGTDGFRKGRENGPCLTHPVSMCPVNYRDDSSYWLHPLLSQR